MSEIRAMQDEASEKRKTSDQYRILRDLLSGHKRGDLHFPTREFRRALWERLTTDSSGQTETIELNAPPEEWSLDRNNERQPYSEYTLDISAPGFEPVSIAGTEILANTKAIQNVRMRPSDNGQEEEEVFVIPAHTLYGDYPPKIAEEEIKPVNESGEIVLSRVVIPEYIVVHDGSPRDSTATNYYVKYKDYIKNVASSEIYATWPSNTIRANVLAIMSFTLNRVYTEWYRNKGYDFTITSSTAFDHKWIPERNIYESISVIVDELFSNYLSRPNVRQPILTQYCDGRKVTCPNWLTQWGSKELGDQGFSPIEILRYYYGDDMYINMAQEISGIPASWPGSNLEQGSRGEKVRQMQEEINVIAGGVSSHTQDRSRRDIRACNCCRGREDPVCLRAPGNRCCGLPDLV